LFEDANTLEGANFHRQFECATMLGDDDSVGREEFCCGEKVKHAKIVFGVSVRWVEEDMRKSWLIPAVRRESAQAA